MAEPESNNLFERAFEILARHGADGCHDGRTYGCCISLGFMCNNRSSDAGP